MTNDVDEKDVYCFGADWDAVFTNDTGVEMTREDAIVEAIGRLGLEPGDSFYLGIKNQLRGEIGSPSGYEVCETLEENIGFYGSPDGFQFCEKLLGKNVSFFSGKGLVGWPNPTEEQKKELTDQVQTVVGQWLDKHGLQPRLYLFGNIERLVVVDGKNAESDGPVDE